MNRHHKFSYNRHLRSIAKINRDIEVGLAVTGERQLTGEAIEACVERVARRSGLSNTTVWHGIRRARWAREVFSKFCERRSKLVFAARFLRVALSDGPRSATQTQRVAVRLGITRNTLRRAFRVLQVRHRRTGGRHSPVEWAMPDNTSLNTPRSISANLQELKLIEAQYSGTPCARVEKCKIGELRQADAGLEA
jgi:hypothetical protein